MPSDSAAARPASASKKTGIRALRFLLRELALLPVTLGIYLFLGWAVMNGVLAAREYSVDRAAAKLARQYDLEAVRERSPKQEVNAAALRLEQASARVGINIVPRGVDREVQVDQVADDEWRAASDAGSEWFQSQVTAADREIRRPPEELLAFMQAYGPEIVELRTQLIEGALPVWEFDLDDPNKQVRYLLGFVHLARLLAADSLVQLWQGDQGAASADLEALWRLSRTGANRPFLIETMISMAMTRFQIGILRRADRFPKSWISRLADPDYHDRLMLSLSGGAWVSIRNWQEAPASGKDGGESRGTTRSLLAFFDRYERATSSLEELRPYLNPPTLQALCAERSDPTLKTLEDPDGEARESYDFVRDSFIRLIELELALELTDKIRQLETAWAEKDRIEADVSSRIAESGVCPDSRWDLEWNGNSVTLALGDPPSWTEERATENWILPTRFTVELAEPVRRE